MESIRKGGELLVKANLGIYLSGNCGPERVSDLHKVTQQMGKVGTKTQGCHGTLSARSHFPPKP